MLPYKQAPDLGHEESEHKAHHQRQQGGDSGPTPAAGFFIDGVDRGAARIMHQTEQHQVDGGQRGPTAAAKQRGQHGVVARLEHHARAIPHSGQPRRHNRQHQHGGDHDLVGGDRDNVGEQDDAVQADIVAGG